MPATAPVCNVTVTAPAPDPGAPKGFRLLSPTATMQDVINAVNSNTKAMQQAFNDMLATAMDNGLFPKTTYQIKPGQKGALGDEMDRRMGKLAFIEKDIKREKIRVENPEDSEDFIVDDRVKRLIMTDTRTGAQWVFADTR